MGVKFAPGREFYIYLTKESARRRLIFFNLLFTNGGQTFFTIYEDGNNRENIQEWMKKQPKQIAHIIGLFQSILRRNSRNGKEDEKHIHKMNTKDREKNSHKA